MNMLAQFIVAEPFVSVALGTCAASLSYLVKKIHRMDNRLTRIETLLDRKDEVDE